MTSEQEVQAQLADALRTRPEAFEAIRRNRKRLSAAAEPEPSDQDLEDETRQLVQAALQENPARRQVLLANRQKNLERRAPVKFETPDLGCPFCGAPAQVVEVQNSVGTLAFRWPPQDCCEDARLISAERALRYSMNPSNDDEQRQEHAVLYRKFLAKLTRPAALVWLAELTSELLGRMSYTDPGYSRSAKDSS